MEHLQVKVTELTGALNAVLTQLKTLDKRTKDLEQRPGCSPVVERSVSPPPLCAPTTEEELYEIGKLPDCVKDLQVFEGDPTQYVSWIHSVESILKDYEIVRQKPIYRAIIQAIRRKCRGGADAALTSYNIFDDSWAAIKNCLSLHYADKRDVRTLEHQLTQLTQKNMTVDEFYAKVNHQLSLIINKLKTENYSEETTNVLIGAYRDRTLEVFTRGLNGELSKMLMLMKPKTLPEAYSQCIELRNTNYRSQVSLHSSNFQNRVQVPVGLTHFEPGKTQRGKSNHQQTTSFQKFVPRGRYQPHLNPFIKQQYGPPPPRAVQQPGPNRPEPMEVDSSTQFKRADSNANRAWNQKRRAFSEQRRSGSAQRPFKQQRLFHIEKESMSGNKQDIQPVEEELNFMANASLAYHT